MNKKSLRYFVRLLNKNVDFQTRTNGYHTKLEQTIRQRFEIPKNEHKVQIKFQLWLIFGAHCNLFFGLP